MVRTGRESGEVARARLARWLTWALGLGGGEAGSGELKAGLVRIPTRRVDEGGFDSLVRTRDGRLEAERWWAAALAVTPEDAPSRGRRGRRWRR